MSTGGTIVINAALGMAGVTSGLSSLTGQLNAFKAKFNGEAQAQAQAAANAILVKAQNNVLMSTDRLNVANLRLTQVQSKAAATAIELAAAEARVRTATIGAAEAQGALATAQRNAQNPMSLSRTNPFPLITTSLVLASTAMEAFGAESVRAAISFEYQMRLIQTQARASKGEVETMSEAVLGLAGTVQTGPEQLAKGLYHIESVGFRAADAFDVLKTAAMGAAVGNADLESVTNALVAVVTTGIKGTQNYAEAMGVLNAVVGVGNLRMQDLAHSLSSGVLSTAKQFGLSLQDVGAALATMADQGIPAEEAATRLRITIALLGAPTKIASDQLGKIGLTSRALADEMRGPHGLIGALTLLATKMNKSGLDAVEQSQLLKTAFGGSRSSAGILTLINSLGLMERKFQDIKNGQADFGERFAEESSTAEAQFRNLSATVEVLKIRLGNAFMPVARVVSAVLMEIAKHTTIVGAAFAGLSTIITAWAAISVGRMIKAMIEVVAQFLAQRLAAFGFGNAIQGVTVDTDLLASSQQILLQTQQLVLDMTNAQIASLLGVGEAAGTATAAVDGLVAGFAGADGAIAATQASTGGLVAGFAGANGAIEATVASTGPLVAGFAGMNGAMEATFAATGPLIEGFAGIDGAIAATFESTGPLVAGLAGVNGAQEAVVASTGPIITSLTEEAAAMRAVTGAAEGLAVAEEAVAAASTAVVPPAAAATGILSGLTAIVGKLILPVTILVFAFTLLMSNLERVGQGLRVFAYLFLGMLKLIVDAASNIPFIGDQFKGLSKNLEDAQNGLKADMAKAEGEINAKADKFSQDVSFHVSQGFASGIGTGLDGAKSATQTMVDVYGTTLAGVEIAAKTEGAASMDSLAEGILSAQNAPGDAFKKMLERMKTQISPVVEIARNVGLLASKELADGLASDDAGTAASAEAARKHAEERLNQLTDYAFMAGAQAGSTWQDAFRDALKQGGLDDAAIEAQINQVLSDPAKVAEATDKFRQLGNSWKNLAPDAKTAANAYKQFLTGLTQTGSAADQAKAIIATVGENLKGLDKVGRKAGTDVMGEVAKGLLENRNAPLNALKELHKMFKDQFSRNREIALLWAEMQSKDLARGLRSSDPVIRAQAIYTRKLITDQLDALTGGAYSASLAAGANVGKGLSDSKGVVSAGAANAVSGATPALGALVSGGSQAGTAAGQNVGIGIGNQSGVVAAGASKAVNPFMALLAAVVKGSWVDAVAAGKNIASGVASQAGSIGKGAAAAVSPIVAIFTALSKWAFAIGKIVGLNFNIGVQNGIHSVAFSQAHHATAPSGSSGSQPGQALDFAKILAAALKQAGSQGAYLAKQLASVDGALKGVSGAASTAKSAMTTAFDAIKAKAHQFFDTLHEKNIKAIHDAHDLKNALLDAKEALNQQPVTAAQKALDFQQRAQEEYRLRKAVSEATDPQSRMDAIQALQNFLAQKHIDMMQDEVDAANAAIELQKKANDAQEATQVAAENKRYAQQKKDFDRQLTALENFLKHHPAKWAQTQAKIVALLKSYGITYHSAGALLGASFVKGLKTALAEATKAAKALAAAGNPSGTSATTSHAAGAWELPRDEVAQLHAREMVIPPNVSDAVRRAVGGRGFSSIPYLLNLGVKAEHSAQQQAMLAGAQARPVSLPTVRRMTSVPVASTGNADAGGGGARPMKGGGTIVFMVGTEKLAELTDRSLFVQDTIYGEPRQISGSVR